MEFYGVCLKEYTNIQKIKLSYITISDEIMNKKCIYALKDNVNKQCVECVLLSKVSDVAT